MSEELKACPFCGKDVAVVTTEQEMWPDHEEWGDAVSSFCVVCNAEVPGGSGGCGVSSGFFASRSEAVRAWNGRIGIPLGLAPAVLAEREAMAPAARDVLAERKRQIEAAGWTPEHDDEHGHGEMACAAACYALKGSARISGGFMGYWPWPIAWWKPKNPRRDLVRAGALILAEIERFDRAGAKEKS